MKIIVLVSGGLDSIVMALKLQREGNEIIPVNFNYGSKHNLRERQSAREIFGDKLIEINIDLSHLQKSSLINKDKEIIKGDYSKENIKEMIVSFRNPLMLSYAVGIAEEKEAKAVAIGNHNADHYIYPDCRPDFIKAFRKAVKLGTDTQIELLTPFSHIDKSHIIQETAIEDIPILYKSYSCYKGGDIHCGICSTCQQRKQAFKDAKIEDKTDYLE